MEYNFFITKKGKRDMSKKINIDTNRDIVDDEDYEYEKKLAEEELSRQRELERQQEELKKKRLEKERLARKRRDEQIAREKLELLQLKSGVINEEDATIKEEHHEATKLTGKAWLANFWYHNKFIVLVVMFFTIVLGFMIYSVVTRKKPDLTIMMIADNDLSQRTQEIEEFFEKYTDDVDGNGYVHVAVISIPISDRIDSITLNGNSSKFYSQVQAGDAMIVITDSNNPDDYLSLMNPVLSEDFPGNKYIDEIGFSFNSKVMAQELKYEYMPNDVHMSIRFPIKTMEYSKKEAKELYDKSFVVFKRIVEDITKRCEEENDPGLETEPLKIKEDADSSKKEDL